MIEVHASSTKLLQLNIELYLSLFPRGESSLAPMALCPVGTSSLSRQTNTLFTPASREDWSSYLSILYLSKYEGINQVLLKATHVQGPKQDLSQQKLINFLNDMLYTMFFKFVNFYRIFASVLLRYLTNVVVINQWFGIL